MYHRQKSRSIISPYCISFPQYPVGACYGVLARLIRGLLRVYPPLPIAPIVRPPQKHSCSMFQYASQDNGRSISRSLKAIRLYRIFPFSIFLPCVHCSIDGVSKLVRSGLNKTGQPACSIAPVATIETGLTGLHVIRWKVSPKVNQATIAEKFCIHVFSLP